MKLYFFRHAIAEDASATTDDYHRALTKKGIARTKAAAKALAALGVSPARLYSSPLVRARQTADLLAPVLDVKVEERSEVAYNFNLQTIETLIAGLGENDDVMFVGHEPDMSRAVAALIGGGEVTMKRGGLARVDLVQRQPLRGTLIWLLAPKVLDRLKR